MAISKFFGNVGTKTRSFFGQAHSKINKSVRYLNDHILPNARKAGKFITDVNQKLQESPEVGDKAKRHLNKINALADAGIKNLSDTTNVVNRVHSVM